MENLLKEGAWTRTIQKTFNMKEPTNWRFILSTSLDSFRTWSFKDCNNQKTSFNRLDALQKGNIRPHEETTNWNGCSPHAVGPPKSVSKLPFWSTESLAWEQTDADSSSLGTLWLHSPCSLCQQKPVFLRWQTPILEQPCGRYQCICPWKLFLQVPCISSGDAYFRLSHQKLHAYLNMNKMGRDKKFPWKYEGQMEDPRKKNWMSKESREIGAC